MIINGNAKSLLSLFLTDNILVEDCLDVGRLYNRFSALCKFVMLLCFKLCLTAADFCHLQGEPGALEGGFFDLDFILFDHDLIFQDLPVDAEEDITEEAEEAPVTEEVSETEEAEQAEDARKAKERFK